MSKEERRRRRGINLRIPRPGPNWLYRNASNWCTYLLNCLLLLLLWVEKLNNASQIESNSCHSGCWTVHTLRQINCRSYKDMEGPPEITFHHHLMRRLWCSPHGTQWVMERDMCNVVGTLEIQYLPIYSCYQIPCLPGVVSVASLGGFYTSAEPIKWISTEGNKFKFIHFSSGPPFSCSTTTSSIVTWQGGWIYGGVCVLMA